jgi:hypothetical protein
VLTINKVEEADAYVKVARTGDVCADMPVVVQAIDGHYNFHQLLFRIL